MKEAEDKEIFFPFKYYKIIFYVSHDSSNTEEYRRIT